MQCIIPGKSVKLFSKMVQCLQKIGEELHMEARPNEFVLRTLNQARSAYFCFVLPSTFFEEYALENGVVEALRFKSLLKPTMAVFKSVNAVEKCSVKFMEDDPKLIFEMHCKMGVKKTYKLNVEDCEPVQAVYDKSACPHELLSKPGVLISAVATFPATVDDISFGLSKEHVRLRSFIDESKRKPSSSAAGKDPNATRPLLTELTLDSADFDKYQLSSDKIEVVFSLRDLKAITAFCEAAMQPVHIYIDEPGKPLLFSMEMYNIFRADFVLATLQDHMEPQADTPSNTQQQQQYHHHHQQQQTTGSSSTPSRSTPTTTSYNNMMRGGVGGASSSSASPSPYNNGGQHHHYHAPPHGQVSPQTSQGAYANNHAPDMGHRNQPGHRRAGIESDNDHMAPMLKKMKVEEAYEEQQAPLPNMVTLQHYAVPPRFDQDMEEGDVPDSQE